MTGRKVLVDRYVPSAARQWLLRAGLATAIAIALAAVPELLGADRRLDKLRHDRLRLRDQETRLRNQNEVLDQAIVRLRSDLHAVEELARDELGLVYPDEIVIEVTADPSRNEGLTTPVQGAEN